VRSSDFSVGTAFLILGLAKKVLIADECAPLSTPVFDRVAAGELVSTTEAWSAALAYSMQLYFDFSGYSDMAIGLARFFGIRLPVNFHSPYQARNIVDFWRRWHMTLSRFLRDYLYIPLGGNRYGPRRRYANLLLTMLLGGIWHGAGWTFAVWGLLHGVYLCINHAWQRLASRLPLLNHRLLDLPYRSLTFLAVLVAWVYFRALDIPTAHRMLQAMSGLAGTSFSPASSVAEWGSYLSMHLPVAFAALVAFFLPNSQTWLARYRPVLEHTVPHPRLRLRLNFPTAATLGVVLTACLLGMNQLSEFLYYQF
jgi:D-alanyl-lipoteichoic acid acyltransferase DltB (MBOAT superfamily)